MIKLRGHKAKWVRIDGELYELRKLIEFGNSSKALIIPRAWMMAIEAKGDLIGLALEYNATVLTVRPYYGEDGDK